MRGPSNEVRAHLAKWKKDTRMLNILFVNAEDPAMRSFELEMLGKLADFHEQALNARFESHGGTSLKLSLRDCSFQVTPGRVPLSAEEGLKIQFPGGETCLVAVLPAPPL